MKELNVHPIGKVRHNNGETTLELDREYAGALRGLEGFSHIQLLWWFDQCDGGEDRGTLQESRPYKNGPEILGTFATRSPLRPNPIALSTVQVTYVDPAKVCIGIAYIDADNGSPILDIKPYTPSLDRVENPAPPAWCGHWPESIEASGDFDWANEFNF